MSCRGDEHVGPFSQPAAVILLFAPGLSKPYPLIPAVEYRVCQVCDEIFILISRAAESHPVTRRAAAGPWSRAIVVFNDGHGADVKVRRPVQAKA